jgi:hypothetical protein
MTRQPPYPDNTPRRCPRIIRWAAQLRHRLREHRNTPPRIGPKRKQP